ncbi:MAG TPA: SRPBCC domain-containing protein [Candidatus Aquilonibacter sp.]|nr:SRPBCC domain-containing protein [Candidatus Aquilonibacter sp.]
MQTTTPAAVLRRTYTVSPERLYEAWTTPQVAQQFLGPSDVKASDVEMDVRVGGSYRIVMNMSDGERWAVKGTYRIVAPPNRLQMTWVWEESDPREEHETLLTLEFKAIATGTELTLTHERFASEESRAGHTRGWEAILDQLGSVA